MADFDFDKLSQKELIDLKRSLLEYWLSNRAKLQGVKPKKDDYQKAENFETNLTQWELNYQENEKLFEEYKSEFDKRIKKRSSELTEPEILVNMYEEELRFLPLLGKEGRTILSDSARKVHKQREVRSLPFTGIPESSIDRFERDKDTGELKLVQRRFYDAKGNAEQDFDYDHQDSSGTHIFPHIHIWSGYNRSEQIFYNR